MRERAIRCGKTASLVGVLAEPSHAVDPSVPAVILLNSGILHHVGASRLHVQIARRLADQGHLALRFDFSGIGDSEARKDTLPFVKSAVIEVREAMDYLETRGARTFVLIGLCSGADMAFKVAGMDSRVVGLGQMDAFAYRTLGYHLRHYGARLGRVSSWKGFIGRKLRHIAPVTAAPRAEAERDPESETPEYRRKFPPRAEVERDLRQLVARSVRLMFIFSGGQEEHYNHRGQYAASFRAVPFANLLRVEYIGAADHLFTDLRHQRIVVGMLAEWVAEFRPAASVPAGATAVPVAPPPATSVAATR